VFRISLGHPSAATTAFALPRGGSRSWAGSPFFLRLFRRRRKARKRALRRHPSPRCWFRSSRVASGGGRTQSRRVWAWVASTAGGGPPPWGLGSHEPVGRGHRSPRVQVERPTPNRRAICRNEPSW
jgi:hypothetical protein